MTSPSLVLPAPPPAPGNPTPTFQRLPSSASTLRGGPAATPYPPYPVLGEAGVGGEQEPSVDEITRELSSLSDLVSSIASACTTILTLRDSIIASSSSGIDVPLPQLEQLSSLTTSTGQLILSLSTQLVAAESKLAHLRDLVNSGTAAALPQELSRLDEQLSIVRSDAAEGIARVKLLATEEEEAEESARRRLEERVRRENGGRLTDEAVEGAVRGAFEAARRGRVEGMDLRSYSARVALESPFTELAGLIETAKEERASLAGDLSRQNTRLSTATTLVGSSYAASSQYGKLNEEGDLGEGDEDDKQGLLPGRVRGTLLGDVEAPQGNGGEGKMSRWRKVRLYWREYLVRASLLFLFHSFLSSLHFIQSHGAGLPSRLPGD
ncbi:hypothetical protein JCM11251_004053 [Rhodosporidiobolus azoricus]